MKHHIEPDFIDLIKALKKNKVKFCIVGAYAVIYYTRPRFTEDLDIYIEATIENAEKTIKALKDFGFANTNLSVEDITEKRNILQFGVPPVAVHITSEISGVENKEIWDNVEKSKLGDEETYVLGLGQLIKNKKMTSLIRTKDRDLGDLDTLRDFYKDKFDKIVPNIKPDAIKEPSAPYNAISIRNEGVLKSFNEAARLISQRKGLTEEQKHTLANLLSSERFELVWFNRKHTAKTRIAAAELTANPDNENKILRGFTKQEKYLIMGEINGKRQMPVLQKRN